MEDKRAHERLDKLEKLVEDNTISTRNIEKNTGLIVEIMQGARGIMLIIVVLAKIGVAVAAIYAVWQGFLIYLRGQ